MIFPTNNHEPIDRDRVKKAFRAAGLRVGITDQRFKLTIIPCKNTPDLDPERARRVAASFGLTDLQIKPGGDLISRREMVAYKPGALHRWPVNV